MRERDLTPKEPFLDEIIVLRDEDWQAIANNANLQYVEESGKLVSGRFPRNIRIDNPHADGYGQRHAHVFGRRGDQLGVVNLDGTGSHGTSMRLHRKDADALRANNFDIPKNRVVEWIAISNFVMPMILLEG